MTLSVSLGSRLQTVASFVPKGANLGDIGTDHAYLPIVLYETQRISKAIAIDIHEGPYRSALTAVQACHLEGVIDVRLGDGLRPLKSGEVDVLTLAGMGGRTMLAILSARPDILESVQELILQPQGAESTVRLALLADGWRLKAERLVEEDDQIYVVMAYSKDIGWNEAELQTMERHWIQRLHPIFENGSISATEFQSLVQKLVWHFGPLVLEERTHLLAQSINVYRRRLVRRIEQMKRSKNPEITTKIREAAEELALVEGLQLWQ